MGLCRSRLGRSARPDSGLPERGFTLVEMAIVLVIIGLLVVIVILGILAAIAIPMFMRQRYKAQDSSAQFDLGSLTTATGTVVADNSGPMPTGATLKADIERAGFKGTPGNQLGVQPNCRYDGSAATVDPGTFVVWATSERDGFAGAIAPPRVFYYDFTSSKWTEREDVASLAPCAGEATWNLS